MATFTQLQSRLREDILAEDSTAFFSDADLLGFLSEASIEIASAGGFPFATSASNVSSSTTAVSAPTDISHIGPRGGVSFASFPLQEKEFRVIELYQGVSGQTRYYNFDSRKGGDIELAPATSTSGTVTVKYVQDLSSDTYSGSDTPWNGVLDSWHDAIVYAAAVKAFERSQEYEMAQYWRGRLQERLQTLALYLNDTSVLSVTAREEAK